MENLTVTISSELAALIRERQEKSGLPTLDAMAAALIAEGLLSQRLAEDHSGGLSDVELGMLIDAADASGPAQPWDRVEARREVLRGFAERAPEKK